MSDLRDWVAARAAHDLLERRLTRVIAVPAPTVGTDWVVTVPGGVHWDLVSVIGAFTTSAVVSNRNARLSVFDQDGNRLARIAQPTAQVASGTNQYLWCETVMATLAPQAATVEAPLPIRRLFPAWTLRTDTGSIDVGDSWANVFLVVRDWSPSQVGQHLEKILGDELFATYADREV